MGRLFGTDGVRGIANSELTPELAFKLGKASGYVLGKKNEKERPVFIIGKDTRISGDMLEDAISAGLMATGVNVIKVGVLPTPAIAHLVREYGADAGIIISASHNSFEYSGIKFFGCEGFKLDDDFEDQVETILLRDIDVNSHITGERIGKCLDADDEAELRYARFLESTIDTAVRDTKIVVDCANGAASKVAKTVFDNLGVELILINSNPNGLNINEKCGSTHPEQLQKEVVEQGAAMGFAYDGDGDRVIAVDEKGRIVDGDKIMCICADMMIARNELPEKCVTATEMSNAGFFKHMKEKECTVDVTQVGDRYVLEKMLETGCMLGGEQSGHVIFLNHATTGDGILTSLQFMQAVKLSGKTASQLSDEIKIYPQVLKNARVREENKGNFTKDAEIMNRIEEIRNELGESGKVFVRPSGTESLVRVMIEGEDTEVITGYAQELTRLITKRFS